MYMIFKEFDGKVAVRLDKGDEIIASLTEVAEKLDIRTAFFSAIGATDDFTVGVFSLETKDYERFDFTGNHEITELSGNITTVDSKPYIHAHITCAGENAGIVGGHLLRAVVSLTAELFIIRINAEITRAFDPEAGINKLLF